MGCQIYPNMIVCNHTAGTYRLPLADGTRVYMDWHEYLRAPRSGRTKFARISTHIGPIFFKDKMCLREIEDWYENELICDALSWFQKRGDKA